MIGDDDQVFGMAADAAALTHGHPSGYLSAGHLAVTIAGLLRSASMTEALDAADAQLRSRERHAEVTDAVAAGRALAALGRPSPEQLETLGEGWVAEEALALSVCCASAALDFADGVLSAANHSGDSDSTAAITGNLLGAQRGTDAIPAPWLEELELRPQIERLASDMHAVCTGQMTSKEAWDAYPGW